MNIVLILDNITRYFGGGEYSILKLCENLSERGHKIYIYYMKTWNVIDLGQNHNMDIDYIYQLKFMMKGIPYINLTIEKIYDLFTLKRFLKKYSKNIDYILGYQIKSAIKAMNLGMKYQIKVVNFIFESPNWLIKQRTDWAYKWKTDIKFRNYWMSFRDTLKLSKIIIPNSKLCKNYTEQWLNMKISDPVYPGITPDKILPLKHKKENQIIFIGRLEKYKNVNDILLAMEKIKFDIKFVICGDGIEKQALMKTAKRLNIPCDFLGTISEDEKWNQLAKSKILIFPSSFEGFGMPPMEALSVNTPCICSDIPILRDIYGQYVDYFPEHNINKLRAIITYMLENPEYCELKANRGRTYVNNTYTWKRSSTLLEDILLREISR